MEYYKDVTICDLVGKIIVVVICIDQISLMVGSSTERAVNSSKFPYYSKLNVGLLDKAH